MSVLENERKGKVKKGDEDYDHDLLTSEQTLCETLQIIISDGGVAAAFSLTFRVPLGVISAPSDLRWRFSSENTNVNGH